MSGLVFDLGNRTWKWAIVDGLQAGPTNRALYAKNFSEQLNELSASLPKPERVGVVNVGPERYVTMLDDWSRQCWSLPTRRFQATRAGFGIRNGYRDPVRLGADRWAAMVAARRRCTGPVCVVDAGTAVTIDLLDETGLFRGGVILPGLGLQRDSLKQTEGIRDADSDRISVVGQSTAEAVAAGTLIGLAGAIDRILDEQSVASGLVPTVLATGGDAGVLVPLLRHAATIEPNLVLDGVAAMLEEA